MITLFAKIRKEKGSKAGKIRKKGWLPAVLYGPGIETKCLEVDAKIFKKIYEQAGESSLVSLEIEGNQFTVLIHDLEKDPISGEIIHVDFYQPSLKKEILVKVPIVLEGTAPAVKELGGTLVKNISEIEVKALPQDLPKEIKVNVDGLRNFDDHILIKDLKLPLNVKINRKGEEIVAYISRPEKVEEVLAKPVEEKVEDVKVVEKKKPEVDTPES